jgi:hypothetical protein
MPQQSLSPDQYGIYEYWNYDFDFCACGWGGVLSRIFWAGKVWFYDFMIPGNEPVDTA